MQNFELYMQRCLDLACLGKSRVSPNPMVGCVIVHQNQIIGEGWHKKHGDWHAEVQAVQSVRNKENISQSTIYVNLEPCSHYGKTPPCADLLVALKPQKVVVAHTDPNPLVAGRGIQKLQEAGIKVEIGVLATAAQQLNCRFITFMQQKRPYVILKFAQTADGFIAGENFEKIQISNAWAMQRVHQYRSEEDAIWVGKNTALHDNPKLNVRYWEGKNPIKITVDTHLNLPTTLHLFDNQEFTICFNSIKEEKQANTHWVKIDNDTHFLANCLAYLYEQKIQSVLVEGGSKLLQSFLEAGLYDEIRIFNSPKLLKKGIKAPTIPNHLICVGKENIDDNWLEIYRKSE